METNQKKKKKTKKPRIPEGEDPEERSPPTPARRGGAPLGALVSGAGVGRELSAGLPWGRPLPAPAGAGGGGGGGGRRVEPAECQALLSKSGIWYRGNSCWRRSAPPPTGDGRVGEGLPPTGWGGDVQAGVKRGRVGPMREKLPERVRALLRTCACLQSRPGRWGRGRRQPPGRGLWGEAAPPPRLPGPPRRRPQLIVGPGFWTGRVGGICIEWGEPPRAPSPDPRRGQAGGAASPPASPGGGLGRSLFHPRTKPPHAPSPKTELGRGARQAAWEGVRAQEQVATWLSLQPLGCPQGSGPGHACLMAAAAAEAAPDSPGAREAEGGGDGPGCSETPAHPSSGYCLSFGQLESRGNQNGKTEHEGQVKVETRRCERARGRAPLPQRRSGRTDTYCICQVFASYPTPAVHGWKTEPPPTQRARGLGQAGGVALGP